MVNSTVRDSNQYITIGKVIEQPGGGHPARWHGTGHMSNQSDHWQRKARSEPPRQCAALPDVGCQRRRLGRHVLHDEQLRLFLLGQREPTTAPCMYPGHRSWAIRPPFSDENQLAVLEWIDLGRE